MKVQQVFGNGEHIEHQCGSCGGYWPHDSSSFGQIEYWYCNEAGCGNFPFNVKREHSCNLWFHSNECYDKHEREVHNVQLEEIEINGLTVAV